MQARSCSGCAAVHVPTAGRGQRCGVKAQGVVGRLVRQIGRTQAAGAARGLAAGWSVPARTRLTVRSMKQVA